MHFLYNIVTYILSSILKLLAVFNPKLKLFTQGRKHVFSELEKHIKVSDEVIWIHCASLGEFEQGRPLIADSKIKYPKHKIVLSFFSPSGYEVQKNYPLADVVVYLAVRYPWKCEEIRRKCTPVGGSFCKI